jgi:hypothetical protein
MSTQRAFVIQFLSRPGGAFCGRVEHVGSGEAAHFVSSGELLAFLHRLNGSAGATRPARDPASIAAAAGASAGAAPSRPPPRVTARRGDGGSA